MKPIKIDETLDREMQRKARRKAQIEHSGNEKTGTKIHKDKKKFSRKEKHRTRYSY